MNKKRAGFDFRHALLLFAYSVSAIATSSDFSREEPKKCERPWLYFDIGETLIDTATYNFNPMFFLEKVRSFEDGKRYRNAFDYLEDLRKRGFVLGGIMDVPEEWGPHYPPMDPIKDPASAKIRRMMDFIAGILPADGASWIGAPMVWSYFGHFNGSGAGVIFEGRLFLPRNNAERKKSGSTLLFERALALSKAAGCPAIYQGESAEEMVLAEKAGMPAFQVGKTDPDHFYLPVEQISEYWRSYRPNIWKSSSTH